MWLWDMWLWEKEKNIYKFGNGDMLKIYSTLHTIFGDNIQLNEQVYEVIYLGKFCSWSL